MRNFLKPTYGIILCIIIGIMAQFISASISIGAVTIAIVLGIVLGNSIKHGEIFEKGIAYSEKQILQFAIALMGVNLNFLILKELGYQSMLIIIAGITVTISASVLLAKIFKFDKKLALLLGIGNGICGSSAIAATEQIIGVEKEDVGLSVAIVNLLGTMGIFLLPAIGNIIFKSNDLNSGMLIGNTLQAVGQVVAAGFSVSELAGQTATLVKMARILMLTPLVFILIFVFIKKDRRHTDGEKIKKTSIPLFILGFVLFSFIPTLRLLPEETIQLISKISHYALLVAMAGIGLKITFASILRDGKLALLIGSLIFLLQILFSSSIIFMLLK
jgi:uncharacterized integral membrane protein (TIGR00698 family)